MHIGCDILWRGRLYVLTGIDPMNVPDRRAYLREHGAARVFEVAFDEIEEPDRRDSGKGFGSEG